MKPQIYLTIDDRLIIWNGRLIEIPLYCERLENGFIIESCETGFRSFYKSDIEFFEKVGYIFYIGEL